ncbi:Anucleate primary sterigmata protein A [Cytospora mali]|uniref:Anucleate primary sterigmata protein A n=1 Tax=Cytospora mali TaxID=578113 RepID=A0A194VHG0_CYTMA|nr:Anucleate primary sterigmata protein A [Valsa mali var. pyri (nom. inval.)]
MAAWETEDEMTGPAKPVLTTTMDLRRPRSSRTSSRGSKRSRRSVTPPGKISPSPPPMPGSDKTDKSDRIVRDLATDEKLSILDPRRFTPTLHASLVSEILTLRRDQEEKVKVIERLETTLQSTREEEDSVQTKLASTAKENRSLKRQLTLLEGGTSSALSELARERDEAVEAAAETKKRLETVQKKLKSQEEDTGRTYDQWGKDKEEWEAERRNMERKIHVAETRLKTILEEVAAFHAAERNTQAEESDGEDKGRDSDAGSVRSMSIRDSIRFSLVNKLNGHSLADELDFDDDSDYQTDANGRDSFMSNRRHMRNDSRASVMSKSHRRHNSSDSLIRPGSVVRGRLQTPMQIDGSLANGIIQEMDEPPSPAPWKSKVSYTDTGVQYSPPPSPKLAPSKPVTPEPTGVSALKARWESHHEGEATEANQRRKRVSVPARPLSIPPPASQSLMVSASAQTIDVPLSPPKTPKTPFREEPSTPKPKPAVMASVATQTDSPEPPALAAPATPPTVRTIPSIAIHPPTNRPSSPRKSLLPQLSKDFGCQVSISEAPMSSVGVQTEEIRVDQRLDKLPAHLHPSAITSRPTSPAPGTEIPTDPDRHFTPVPGNLPPRNPRRLTSQRSISDIASSPRISTDLETKDNYPGNNDDGPVSPKSGVRRPHRISSLFAGFEAVSSGDEMDEFDDADMSDSEYRTALTAPRPVKSPEPGRNTPSPVPTSPEEFTSRVAAGKSAVRPIGITSEMLRKGYDEVTPVRKGSKGHLRGSGIGGIRKAAMIQSGIATHQEDAKDPPFPIPTRASSRKPPFNPSLPSDGNRSPTRNDQWRKGRETTHYRANSIRKSRSAAPVPYGKGRHRRRNSRSPPYSPENPEASTVPPLPRNGLTTPKNERGRGRGHRHQPSTNTATTEATGFQSNASSQAGSTNVVDAIAQTMVGEWMFKYVRRRKSFGMANDNAGKDDSSNDRHKRWVWLAPYERAILWSSKQPSSGSALLGKSGRKLTIQSVLDVKDDNPPPKGETPVFNRSILILTPQRALKFTAVNAERHYLWLTSLSFLAHSQQQVPDLPAPVSKAPDFELPPSKAKTRRPRIRDSIRLAKGHNNNNNHHNNHANNNLQFPRSGGAEGGLILSQLTNGGNHAAPMPSVPDVPASLLPGYRSPQPAGTESVASGYSNPSKYSNTSHQRDWSRDAAEPPSVPRFQDRDRPLAPAGIHGRKRSNTGGHVPPPISFRGFSSPSQHAPTNSQSTGTGSSDLYLNPSNNSNNVGYDNGPVSAGLLGQGWGGMSVISGRTSEASTRASGPNFFDAIGTMRMEAFISPLAFTRYESDANFPDPLDDGRYRARRRNKEIRRRKSRSRSRHRGGERDSYSSRGTGGRDYYSGSRTAGEEEYSREDPFKGF